MKQQILLAAAAAAALVHALTAGGAVAAGPGVAAYVGAPACATCHASEHAVWRGSQHARSMAAATPQSVSGDFADARFMRGAVSSRFFRRDGGYFVHTDGPDGKPADFEVKYTFGVYPLQQYLVALPGGRLQALGTAWDARPNAEGGQRWFHLYPDRRLKAGDPMHWTGIDQNWNYQCADCHSTNLRKNYDAANLTYQTAWSDINVGCEACHGPGSNHLAWARLAADARRNDATKGLTVALDERAGINWSIDPTSGNAARSQPRASNREVETCARCHARRGQFSDSWTPGQPQGDGFRLALIEPGLYYPDGQMRDEVYNHGSFLQSRMHAKGVTCADCHEPHGQKLRAPGNAVCGQCHTSGRYDVAAHHHHQPGTVAASCTACHLPTTTYMVIDRRHDHSMRIPRPDRTLSLGTPNACGQCHGKHGAKWAADAITRWFAQRKPGYQTFAEAFADGDRGAPGASAKLAALVNDATQPAFVRASAIPRLARNPGAAMLPALVKALQDSEPLVREVAARSLRDADPALRGQLLPRLLADPVRSVRMEAARGLAGAPERPPGAEADRARFEQALEEYRAALRFNADRPESQADLGSLELARGHPDLAIDAFRRALELDPTFSPAAVNLADVFRSRGQEREAEAVLARAIEHDPTAAAPRHALGLSLARQRRIHDAIAALGEAARLAPDDPRYAYVHGVALHDAGRRNEALKVLEAALARHPHDRDLLVALASYDREAGDAARAARRAQLLVELDPDDPNLRAFARQISAGALQRSPPP